MKSYRTYHVGRDGRLELGEAFNARDDSEAAAQVRAIVPAGQPAELWEAGRLVGRVGKDGAFSPGPPSA